MCKFKQGDQIIEEIAPFRKATVLMVTKQNYFIEWSGALSENVIPTEIVDRTFISFRERTEVYEGTLYLQRSPLVNGLRVSDRKFVGQWKVIDQVDISWDPKGDFIGVRLGLDGLKRGSPIGF
jgi:hypothetical protein